MAVSAVSATDNSTSDVVSVEKVSDEFVSVDNEDINETAKATDNSINIESDNTVGATEENELSASAGTFTGLAFEIKNAGSELKLKKDYVYSNKDLTYKDGIPIDKKITIDGNGFTINGNNLARIFKVNSDSVTLKNIKFMKGYGGDDYTTCDGGAIYWAGNYGKVSDCSFVNCPFEKMNRNGGAIYWTGKYGKVSDCNFKDCFAHYGGAICCFGDNFTVSDCSFERCSAIDNYGTDIGYGGAIYWSNNGRWGQVLDCSFRDCSAGFGGSISWNGAKGVVSGCSFRDSTSYGDNERMSYLGGAISWSGNRGKISKCDFVNCKANGIGGAIYTSYCSISGCSFKDCYAKNNGGAIDYSYREGSISKCDFVNCKANDGGGAIALLYGKVLKCSFEKCSAKNGGAIDIIYNNDVQISDSTFKNCKANSNGGAIYQEEGTYCSVINCNFAYNNACNGGATYNIYAKDSFFDSNKAFENGGAMYGGKEYNCLFKDNIAYINSINAYNTEMSRTTLDISTFPTTCEYGSKLTFNFKTISGLPIKYATITIKVYKDNALVGSYKALSGGVWTVNLGVGSYEVFCSVENQDYYVNSANTILKVVKASSKISSSSITTVYNGGKYLVVNLKDKYNKPISGAKISVNLNGVKKGTTNNKGQVKISTNGLAPKKYTAKINFAGNDNYKASSTTAKVTVKKATPKLTAAKKTFKKSVKIKKYTVTLKTNQNKVMKNTVVTLNVNKKTYKVKTNAKGQAVFKITNLKKKGTFTAVIKFAGNKYYNAKTVKPKIIVK